ncbi:MAG: hypothetical protein ACK2UK_05130 [Candidatus Promineifilaceae bacterium]
MEESLRDVGLIIALLMAVSFVLAIILLFFAVRRIRGLHIPDDAGFGETLLYVPLTLVLFIDLLDFGLDILAAPITWFVLDRLGLKALRNVFALEALLPFTQMVPTMTLAWLGARFIGPQAVEVKTVSG